MENEKEKRDIITCFHIEKRQKQYLEKIAKQKGISLSELLRDIVFEYITSGEKITEKVK